MSPFFPDLGVGVGLRPPHYKHFRHTKPSSVSWVEVVTENFTRWGGRPPGAAAETLTQVRSHIPVALHGVSLSIGSIDPINLEYLKNLKQLADRVSPIWISDHLCWTGVDGKNLHDLLPLPYTEEALTLVVSKLNQVQDFLGRQILIENVSSYLQFQDSEMSEWEFLTEVAERADCGILLDVNNVYVSSVNHCFNPKAYLDNIPKERIGQIHLAGHNNKGTHLIDTHDAPVCKEVWDLYRYSIKNFGWVSTMIERDDHIPEWSELEEELNQVAKIRSEENGDQPTRQTPTRVQQESQLRLLSEGQVQ